MTSTDGVGDQDTFSNVCEGIGCPAALPNMFGQNGCAHCVCRLDEFAPPV